MDLRNVGQPVLPQDLSRLKLTGKVTWPIHLKGLMPDTFLLTGKQQTYA